jgi:hypothetical protein
MTERVVDYRIRAAGPWKVLLPGVYLTHAGRPDDAAREMAALLYAGPQSVLTGVAALRRHDLSAGQPGGPGDGHASTVDVLVPVGSRRADVAFARLHRTRRLPGGFCVAGEVRFALPPRAVADAVRPMADLARHARMSAHGIIVLHFPPQRIRSQRRAVAGEIRRALAAGRQLPQVRTISADQSAAMARSPQA